MFDYLSISLGCTYILDLSVNLPKRLEDEMLRTTKKNAPKTTKLYVLLSNFEEHDSSMQTIKSMPGGLDVFSNLIPTPEKQGIVYIGFPTHQTSGCGVSLAAQFIPTVERESIDFADKHLAVWNMELLSVFGIVNRICFENELSLMDNLLQHMELDPKSSLWFYQKISFLANLFMAKDSTPSSVIGSASISSFNSCTKLPFKMISSTGKLIPVSLLREAPSAEMQVFIKTVPTIPPELEAMCPEVIKYYKSLGLLMPISTEDVMQELASRSLRHDEMIAFLKWWVTQIKERKIFRNDVDQLKQHLKLDNGGSVLHFGRVTLFCLQPFASTDSLPLPNHCLAPEFCKGLSSKELESCFWGWKEISALEWILFTSSNPLFSTDAEFTNSSMSAFSRLYSHNKLSASDKVTVVSSLEARRCISTEKHGLCAPEECYFPNVSLFEDLPKVLKTKGIAYADVFLRDLGVREHVDLQIIFDRLSDLNWDQYSLIKYLGSIQEKLKPSEIQSLSSTPIFAKEGGEASRFRANQLFPPIEKFRSFGLPLLSWPSGKWKFTSAEASLMKTLGLNTIIQLSQLIDMIANASEMSDRIALLKFFSNEPEYQSSYNPAHVKTPFICVEGSEKLCLPFGCFSDEKCSLLEFAVCHRLFRPFASKLGIQEAPAGDYLVERLRNNPPSIGKADAVFEFLHSRAPGFSPRNWAALKTIAFIPVKESGDSITFHSPSTVFLKNTSMISHFVYVDFSPLATLFLKACGCNEQPSPVELAEKLAVSPESFLEGGKYTFFLDLLRQVAVNYKQIRMEKRVFNLMKSSKFLLALKTHDEEGKEKGFSLEMAKDIYLVDDPVLDQVFKPFSCPMEPALEAMYSDLGSTWISANVREQYRETGESFSHSLSSTLQETIRERAVLLLYDGHQVRSASSMTGDAKRLLENIEVLMVPRIEIIRAFGMTVKTQETTACGTLPQSPSILVTMGFDYFDVASVIAKMILKTPRLNDSLLISTFLSSTLQNLTRKGFPVERILAVNKVRQLPPPSVRLPPQQTIVPARPPAPASSRSSITTMPSSDGAPSSKTADREEDSFSDFFKKLGFSSGPSSMPPSNPTQSSTITPSEPSSRRALENSIANVKAANEDRIISSIPTVPAPLSQPRVPIMERSCHEVKDLVFIQQLSRHVKLYCATGFEDKAPFGPSALGDFAGLLEMLATQVFGISQPINVFWDPSGRAIAFNRSRQLFFNLRHYIQWHKDRKSSLYYWYLVFCHELAHNEHSPHDETHEYWLSSFADQYMGKLFTVQSSLLE